MLSEMVSQLTVTTDLVDGITSFEFINFIFRVDKFLSDVVPWLMICCDAVVLENALHFSDSHLQ